MNLARALRLDVSPSLVGSVTFVGAGGKTTAIFQLARELGPRVIVSATTHLGAWQTSMADRHIIAERPDEVGEICDGLTLITGRLLEERTGPVNSSVLCWLHEEAQSNHIPFLIEADGARGLPLKAPAAHEPPIPEFAQTVIVVAGLSGLGKPLSEVVFRETEFGRINGATNRQVTAEMVVNALSHADGGLKNIPKGARRVVLLNQADTPELQAVAQKMGGALLKKFDAVIVASMKENKIWAAQENIAGIVLAAGESRRFGKPKQLLDWSGKPFVRQVAETALNAGLSPVIVVTGAHAEGVESALAGLDVTLVRNETWRSGQASSIAAGVGALPENIGASFFLLADQPQIGTDVLCALREVHAQRLSPIIAPLVMEERRANPVLFDRVTFPNLLALTGDVGGRAIFDKHEVEYLPWYNSNLLPDVDTPLDYERLIGQN